MKTTKFPIVITEKGVSAKIRKVTQKGVHGKRTYYVVDYSLLGQRQQVWRAKLEKAKQVATEACRRVANGEQVSLTLTNTDRMVYLRANEALAGVNVPIDTACREYADARVMLAGRAGLAEVCRDWIKRHAVALPRVSVLAAVSELEQQSQADGKSRRRLQQMEAILGRFSRDINAEVHTITPDIISRWLSGLPFAERTRRNYRDVIGFFCRFLVRRGYLVKGTDWLDGVQNYTARKCGEIEIYTPDELKELLQHADKRLVPFLAIGAFAGLRHAEIARLDWSEVELGDSDAFIEVKAEKAKTSVRRTVPVCPTLKSWLLPHRKQFGVVCPFANTTKQLLKVADAAGIEWKHNGLRHSCISYRVAECSNVPLVAEESGNSVQVIRTNYLRRVRPAQAAAWFSIMPSRAKPTGRRLVV